MKGMKLMKELKCICCLFKCSKYLYIAKKIVCVATAVLVAVTALSFIGSDSKMLKSLKGMMH